MTYHMVCNYIKTTVPLVEQELLTLPEHLSSPPGFGWVRVPRSLVLCICFVDCCLPLCLFCFGDCVLLRFTDSDYSFGIVKLFLSLLLKIKISKQYGQEMIPGKYIGNKMFYAKYVRKYLSAWRLLGPLWSCSYES